MGLTLRSPSALLQQYDLHAVVAVVLVDLALTIHGITTGQGSEANPLYAPLTGSFELMLAGVMLYLCILAAVSLVVTGQFRYVLASIAFGMHVAGTMTWVSLLHPALTFNVFWYTLAAAGGTALFYRAELRFAD